MKVRNMAITALISAMYLVVTMLVAPIGFSVVQFRLSELFNHFIVYNKKYFFGIVLGVFMSNLLLSPVKADMIFGVAHTALSLIIVILISKVVKNKTWLMVINAFVFSFNMYIIALMLKMFMGIEGHFLAIYGTLAAGELITMLVLIPLAIAINKALKLEKLIG